MSFKKPIVVRVAYRKKPDVLTLFAGREAEICVGFGVKCFTKAEVLSRVDEWLDVMLDVERLEEYGSKKVSRRGSG